MNKFKHERRRSVAGFTLLELMVVVVILTVLASVAVFSYQGYIRQARMQEALGFLGAIRVRQEMYFQTYSQYVDTGTDVNDLFPASVWPSGCGGAIATWDVDCPTDAADYPGWCALGVMPVGGDSTLFQYLSFGWAPGDTVTPSCTLNAGSGPLCLIPDPDRPWWVAVAQGDQRCDSGGAGGGSMFSMAVVSSQIKNTIIFDVNEGNATDDWGSLSKQTFNAF